MKLLQEQLKAENKELTTINARLLCRLEVDETDTSIVFSLDKELRQKEKEFYTSTKKVAKLEQTLAEIKDIANYSFNLSTSELMAKLEQILQIIDEVKNDE